MTGKVLQRLEVVVEERFRRWIAGGKSVSHAPSTSLELALSLYFSNLTEEFRAPNVCTLISIRKGLPELPTWRVAGSWGGSVIVDILESATQRGGADTMTRGQTTRKVRLSNHTLDRKIVQ